MKTLHTIYTNFAKHNMAKFLTVLTILFTVGIGQMWGESVEINTSNSGVNASYRDYEFDVNSITFGCTQWMKNNNIQAKKSITNSLYNVDAIPGKITSIVVKQTGTARAIKIYGGTSSKPTTQITSPSTAAEMTFDFTGKDYTYFSLTTPSNACYFDKITINYADATPKQKYTLSYQAGETNGTLQVEEGANLLEALGELETPTSCDATSTTFVGWTATEITEKTNTAPTFITSTDVMPSADYAVFAVFAENSGGASFDGTTGGNFKIYAIVNGTKYYAKGTGAKISSTTEESDATEYTFAKTSSGFTIKTGTNYITYSSSTNLGTSTSAYYWNINEGINGSWRITSTASTSRGIIFRASTYNQFGGYSVSNASAGSTEYFDVEIGSSPSYSNFITSCITETTVSLNPNGGTILDTDWRLENGVYKLTTEGESITLPSITRTGYTFGGWATSSGGTKEHNANATINLNGTPVTLYAIWTANKYDITYKDQGDVAFSGTHETGYPTKHTYGTETTLKGATKTGYTFEGWYKEAACTNKVTTLGATDYTGAITLYAKWTAKPLTNYRTFCDVVCDAYSFHTGTGEKETWLKEAIKCFTKEGGYEHEWQIKDYIIPNDDNFFVGNYGYFYNDNLGIGGANGKSRSVVSDWGNMYLAPAMDENDASGSPRLGHAKGAKGTLRIFDDSNWDNLYVGFIPDGYKLMFGDEEYTLAKTTGTEYRSDVVQYNSTNADKNVSVGVVDADDNYVATNHTQEMRHIFLKDNCGWRNDGAKLAIYYWGVSEGWCGFLKTVPGDETLFEGWIPSNATNLKFVRYNSNQSNPGSWDYENDIWNSTGDLTIDGNLFTITDWGTGTWSTYEKYGQFAMHDNSKSKNWYVHFVPHYVLTYDKNADDATGEMDIQTVAVDADDKKVIVADCGFTRPGYRFIKWKYDATLNYNAGVNITLNKDITLYAVWEKEYTVTYDANEGTTRCEDDNIYIEGETVKVCADQPTRTGYTFDGWIRSDNGERVKEGESFTMPDEDVTLTAQWIINKFTVTLNPNYPAGKTGTFIDKDGNTINGNLELTFDYNTPSQTLTDLYKSIKLDGYRFDGWYSATSGGSKWTSTGTITKNVTVYAQWTKVDCRWIETDIANISPDDEVLITMKRADNGNTYTLDHSKGTSALPPAQTITINGNEADFSSFYHNNSIWNISGNVTDGYILYPNGSTTTWLYCTKSNYNVKVGTVKSNVFTIENGYLKHTNTDWMAYVGVYISGENDVWRHHNSPTVPSIAGQTLKFYKRECLDSEHYWVTWDAGEGTWEDKSSKKLESYQVGAPITQPTEPTREGHRFDGWTPAPGNMPAENTTFTAKWTKVYKVTWYENGVPFYTYVPSDNAVVTWEDNIADCGEKKFYGWTADGAFVSDPTTPPTLISKGTTITGDVTYYAVYADAVKPANPGYTKVTTISEGTYLIATGETSSNKAYTGKYSDKTYGGTCDVIVNNQVISTKPTSAVEVEVTLGTGVNSGKFAIYDGTYYLSAPDDNALTFNNNIVYDWKLTADGYINSTGQSARYIQLNSSASPNRFACYSSNQKKAYLYKKQTTTYKNFAVSCATYTIIVTTPTGGTVTTTPADDAGAGQEITINVTPDDCKYLTALKYNDGSDHNINIASTPYTFTMPAADVTVTATFADKIATDIEILTSAHRLLMQGSAFVGEQVRITYNNDDKETLNWNDSRLTFTGHNTATLGSQTVTVTYNGCGTQSASYNIEVIDGLGITFWDGDYTETIKYEPGDLVDVDNKIGQNICSGWEFAGWSETKVANESNGFTPVHNFNATDAKVLYAVYVQTSTDWISAYNIDELHPGAKYVIVAHYSDGKEFALTNTNNTSSSYLDGANLTTDCEKVREGEAYPYKDRYKLKVTPDENWKWQLENTGSGWTMRNIKANKYLKVNSDKTISLTATPDDKFTLSNGYNDSEITAQSSSNYYLSWYNSSKYWNGHTSGQQYYLTNETNFTSTPPCSPLSATFHGNGGIVTDGVNSGDDLTITEPTRDAGITTPTASFADCNGKTWTFVGWAREEIDVTRVPVLTTDLLHDGGGNKQYKIQEDGEEFWAVFTNTGNPETKYGTITFTDADVTRQYENAKTITKSVTAMGDYDFELYRVSNASSKGIQFDHEVATRGYIKNITSLGKINSISLNDFQEGDVDDVKVYVGNMPNAINTLLTEADLQQTGNTYTYYPPKNYAYVKIEATGYCGITSISIDFGKGTQIWATTPNCSNIFLSGNELYVTSTNGQLIRAAERLTVKAVQLESKAKVVISSNRSDIYFSDVLDANFTQAVKPTETLTLTAGVDGNLAATEIYVHYRPSVDGTGIPEDVVVSANLETPNPSISDDQTIHVRNLPADFVIAAKWDGHWYALPANCTSSQSPTEGLLIEVDNIDDPKMAIAAPASAKFGLKSVYTSNSTNDRYEKNGANLVFVENVTEETPVANQTLYNGSETGIQVYAQYANYHTGNALRYEWTPTTTNLLDYTLTSAHTFTKTDGTPEEARTISLGNNGVFGTLLNDKSYNGEVRLLPATFYEPAQMQVLKWKAKSVIVMYTGTETTATTQVGDNAKSAEQTLANQQLTHGIYELTTNQALIDHAGGELNIYIGTKTRVELEIPLIISGEVTASANAHDVVILENSKLTAAETKYSYKDVYVYGGAKLAIPENTELGVNNIILRAGGVATDGAGQNATYQYIYPQVELKGTLTSAVQNIRYEYVTDNDHWYHLVLPFDGSLASIHYPYEYYGDQVKLDNKGSWIIKRYDGATRATGNYDAWVDIETEGKTSTTAGQGYIFWGAPKKVTANGAYERPKWGIQRITMLSKVSETINEATKAEKNDKTVSGLSSHKDVPNNSGAVNDQGWNLIGNPYMVNLTGLNSESLKPGKLVEVEDAAGNWTGQWKDNEDGFRYVTIPSDHFDTYTAQRMTAFTEANPMIAGRAFFIQLEDDDAGVTFSAANRASLLAARVAANEPTTDIETGVVLSNETMQDEVNFWIKDGKTNDYEYNADYPKTPNNNHFNIYGVHTNGHLSWVATGPEFAKESMPIGYQVPDAGTYMLSVSEEYYSDEIDALYVTDHEMSPEVTTDLMSAPYEFSVNQAETNDKRFTVSIKLKKASENDATGLDNININGEEIQKFIYQDKMYILHHGIIYDATGKRVITINK